jgi:hypothetical protein
MLPGFVPSSIASRIASFRGSNGATRLFKSDTSRYLAKFPGFNTRQDYSGFGIDARATQFFSRR